VIDDPEGCYRAVTSRDPRFDGWFIVAVTSTGIYCRPSCPARTPSRANVRFYPTSAAAQAAGFRSCKRCRPDAAPGSPAWDTRADVVARSMRLIGDGLIDREGVPGLAARLGYSTRQLQRLLVDELGAGPLALARAQRAQTARVLIETTDLPFGDVAFAAGFGSIRQFNDTVRAVFDRSPGAMRGTHSPAGGKASIVLRLPYRAPFAAGPLIDFLRLRAVPGVEDAATDGSYRRTLALPHAPGVVALSPADGHVRCSLALGDLRDLATAVHRCRRLLDLDADPVAVDSVLAADPQLAPLVAVHPGLRAPGAVDGAELAVRAVLGQQVSVVAARTIAGRLTTALGVPLPDPHGPLTHLFPTAEAIADAPPDLFPMPASRRRAVQGLAAALADGEVVLDPGADRTDTREALLALEGIGPWTADYLALRALGDPDVLLASDLGVRHGAAALRIDDHPRRLTERGERWRPWRSYATLHLWTSLGGPPSGDALSPQETNR